MTPNDPDTVDRFEGDGPALEHAVEMATRNVKDGGGPFGALVVRDGRVVATGENRVTRDNDPTAHAEVVAIRRACAALGTFSLAGCTLYTSCEPCPLCLAASLWSRLDRVVFAADRHDAARGGFDDSAFHDQFLRDPKTWTLPVVEENRLPSSVAPFDAWLAHPERVDY
ncbi:nucleoside deaminase [Nocardioides sp. CER19]|uniref:nucleoside deaminase n=1 Tax=Nocardioides sp. CER19 TaxID=3038538 RepID=UPI00244AAAD2|nr:nucleoside deaminase [Nocardioides sp. CER19]MDH2413076.1 nucleoside deaminase [Nocardioides sp. CER19]